MKQAKASLPSGEYLIQEVPHPQGTYPALWRYNSFTAPFSSMSSYHELIDCIGRVIKLTGNKETHTLLGADPTALTEEEAGEIVESLTVQVEIPQRAAGFGWYTKFKNYQSENQFSDSFFIPTASLDSLAASLGISKPYVILKLKTEDHL